MHMHYFFNVGGRSFVMSVCLRKQAKRELEESKRKRGSPQTKVFTMLGYLWENSHR